MSVPREELVFLSFLVQQNGGDFSKVRKFVQGDSLSLSLSLVFVVAFHQTHLIPVKDRQTDRQTDTKAGRQTYVSVSLSLSRSFGISRREFDVAFFLREN